MKEHIAPFKVFHAILEEFNAQNYPEEMIRRLKERGKRKRKPKIVKPKFK